MFALVCLFLNPEAAAVSLALGLCCFSSASIKPFIFVCTRQDQAVAVNRVLHLHALLLRDEALHTARSCAHAVPPPRSSPLKTFAFLYTPLLALPFAMFAFSLRCSSQVNDVLKGEMSVEHTAAKSSTRATLDVEGAWVRTSSCMAVGSKLLVGAQGDFIVAAPKVCASVSCVSVRVV